MIIVKELIGREADIDLSAKQLDVLELEWHELSKRIIRKYTLQGQEVACKFTAENISLRDGDILFMDDNTAIIVRVLKTQCIVISPKDMVELATVCYEIGNKHMPLYIDGNDIVLPYEAPMFKWLEVAGYNPKEEERRIERRLKSKSGGHHHHHSHGHSHSHDHSHDHGVGLLSKVVGYATKLTHHE
ncbi:MAG: urease accessory protein UreE [Rikenellaceae bacterium]